MRGRHRVLEPDPAMRALETRLNISRWSVTSLGILAFATAAAAISGTISLTGQPALILAGLLSLILCGAMFAYYHAKVRLENYRAAEKDIAAALRSSSSTEIYGLRRRLRQMAASDRLIHDFCAQHTSSIDQRLGDVLEAEVLEERRLKVAARCAEAKRALSDRIEQQRIASPAIRAERTITGAIENLKRHKAEAEKQLDEQRERRLLKWWFDLTRPGFEDVDAKIEELEAARQRLIASGDIAKTEAYYGALFSLVDRRTADIERAALSAIPAQRAEGFDDQRILQNALLLSALSVPVSAWRDISQAGSVYDSLREVNGNYANMSDADIWLDTLIMPGPQLAGLANLTKGALFERHVEADFGGERFAHFNHPDTDILLDGEAIQIKATDSVGYINSVADDIPVISTSEVADITGSIDGGYTNEELTNVVDLALGGTVIDIGDTALDAVLTGVGGVGIFAILRGVQSASAKYKENGDAIESLVEGVSATATGTARSAVNMAEIATKATVGVVTSKPMRFTGGLMMAAAKSTINKVDQWLEQPEEETLRTNNAPAIQSGHAERGRS